MTFLILETVLCTVYRFVVVNIFSEIDGNSSIKYTAASTIAGVRPDGEVGSQYQGRVRFWRKCLINHIRQSNFSDLVI